MTQLVQYSPNDELCKAFPEFTKIRIYGTKDEPLFLGVDIQKMLDLKMFHYERDYDLEDDYIKIKEEIGGQYREVNAFTEDGLYNVIARSRTPLGKRFRKFVKIILKELRLKGEVTLPTALEKLQTYLALEKSKNEILENENKMLDAQLVKEHNDHEKTERESKKFYKQYIDAYYENLKLKERERQSAVLEKGSPEYNFEYMKKCYCKRLFITVVELKPKLEKILTKKFEDFEKYDHELAVDENDVRVYSLSFTEPVNEIEVECWVHPQTTMTTIDEILTHYKVDKRKLYYTQYPNILHELDQLCFKPTMGI